MNDPHVPPSTSAGYNSVMLSPSPQNMSQQIFWLFILAIPIATIARTVVFEEVFREPREYCEKMSEVCRSFWARKFFYLFTCEYCFSHWITLFFLWLTRFKLLLADWRGYIIAWFALVFVANIYLNLYARLRVDITIGKKDIEVKEKHIEKMETEIQDAKANSR